MFYVFKKIDTHTNICEYWIIDINKPKTWVELKVKEFDENYIGFTIDEFVKYVNEQGVKCQIVNVEEIIFSEYDSS